MEANFTRGPYQRDGRSIFKLVENPETRKGRPEQINLWMASVQPCGIAVDTAELESVATLFQASPLLYEVLEAVEWISSHGFTFCPCCNHTKQAGHALDCALNNALRAARGEI